MLRIDVRRGSLFSDNPVATASRPLVPGVARRNVSRMPRVWVVLAVLALTACTSSSKTKTPVNFPAKIATTTTRTITTASPATNRGVSGSTAATPSTPLRASSYGFSVPTGWTEQPLTNFGGPVSNAHFYEPGTRSSILYVISGGESGIVYKPDGTVNLEGAVSEACVGSAITAHFQIASDAIGYTCAPTEPGTEVNGVVVIDPTHKLYTWKKLEVGLPPKRHALASEILNGFRP